MFEQFAIYFLDIAKSIYRYIKILSQLTGTVPVPFFIHSICDDGVCRSKLAGIEINRYPFTSIARPTVGKEQQIAFFR